MAANECTRPTTSVFQGLLGGGFHRVVTILTYRPGRSDVDVLATTAKVPGYKTSSQPFHAAVLPKSVADLYAGYECVL
ncbi:hypothetical protein EYZ11_002010 [Aspergillus tanneri]|uniref:Uncharacterized protein n=1 Tax=Aspergillus tanneri TaxID=1220188 RepID=A0A4S3JRX8_9EURO|nr:hypothetical protein EYZ11_002010 [Aspergillus tanneri]